MNKYNYDNLWSIGIYIHIHDDFIKVEYSRLNSCVISIANDRRLCFIKVIWNRGNHIFILKETF